MNLLWLMKKIVLFLLCRDSSVVFNLRDSRNVSPLIGDTLFIVSFLRDIRENSDKQSPINGQFMGLSNNFFLYIICLLYLLNANFT